jgi:hypothetical protein
MHFQTYFDYLVRMNLFHKQVLKINKKNLNKNKFSIIQIKIF